MTLVPQTVLGERKINTNASSYITKLYNTTEKSTVTNDSITYNTSPSQLLMNDRKGSSSTGMDAGNIRYYGASPDNYVYFNCSDYSNPSSSTCELWRIIGVFDGKVKLIRNEGIGDYSWDTTASTTNSGHGINDWSTAKLMMLLNDGYTYLINNLSIHASSYWNGTSGTCYNAGSLGTTSCDFTSTGIKNDTTRNMISETTYNLGGLGGGTDIYSNKVYVSERGTTVYSGRPTTWNGKITIPYGSDYSYAADLSKCSNSIYNYNDSTCTSNNWMKSIMSTSSYNWLLTPQTNYPSISWFVTPSGDMKYSSFGNDKACNVLPALYLNPATIITTGEGTKDSPYKIKYEDSVKGEYFNGKTDYKKAGFANYNFGKTITMVARFKIENYGTSTGDLVGNWEGAGGGLFLYNGNELCFNIYNTNTSNYPAACSSTAPSLNEWHTAVGTYNGTTSVLYLDGTKVGSNSFSASISPSPAGFMVGANPGPSGSLDGELFKGYISDALVIDSTLSSSIISSYYGKNFSRTYNNPSTLFKYSTADTAYKLKGYNFGYVNDGIQLHLDGKNNGGYSRSTSVKTWYDLSNNRNNGTITGTTWGTNYLSFASSNDRVENSSATYKISSAYTLEVVLRPIDQISDYQIIFSTVSTGASVKQYMSMWSSRWDGVYTPGSYRIENGDGTNSKSLYFNSIDIAKNTAYTLTATLNGKTLKRYINGSLVGTDTLTFTPKMSGSGLYISNSSYSFDGYIYSVRVYNRELSASEISANYQNDKSRFGL